MVLAPVPRADLGQLARDLGRLSRPLLPRHRLALAPSRPIDLLALVRARSEPRPAVPAVAAADERAWADLVAARDTLWFARVRQLAAIDDLLPVLTPRSGPRRRPIVPDRVVAGSTTEVAIGGRRLAGASSLTFDRDDISASDPLGHRRRRPRPGPPPLQRAAGAAQLHADHPARPAREHRVRPVPPGRGAPGRARAHADRDPPRSGRPPARRPRWRSSAIGWRAPRRSPSRAAIIATAIVSATEGGVLAEVKASPTAAPGSRNFEVTTPAHHPEERRLRPLAADRPGPRSSRRCRDRARPRDGRADDRGDDHGPGSGGARRRSPSTTAASSGRSTAATEDEVEVRSLPWMPGAGRTPQLRGDDPAREAGERRLRPGLADRGCPAPADLDPARPRRGRRRGHGGHLRARARRSVGTDLRPTRGRGGLDRLRDRLHRPGPGPGSAGRRARPPHLYPDHAAAHARERHLRPCLPGRGAAAGSSAIQPAAVAAGNTVTVTISGRGLERARALDFDRSDVTARIVFCRSATAVQARITARRPPPRSAEHHFALTTPRGRLETPQLSGSRSRSPRPALPQQSRQPRGRRRPLLMRAVWSFWSRPHHADCHRLWVSDRHHLLAWMLSVETAQPALSRHGPLHGCRRRPAARGRAAAALPAGVDDARRLADSDPAWWNLGKLYAYRASGTSRSCTSTAMCSSGSALPPEVATGAVIVQNPEEFEFDGCSWYQPEAMEAAVRVGADWLPGGVDLAHRAPCRPRPVLRHPRRQPGRLPPPLCGPRHPDHGASRQPDGAGRTSEKIEHSVLVEQYLLAACLDFHAAHPGSPFHGIEARCLFPTADASRDPEAARRAGYTHLIGVAKTDPDPRPTPGGARPARLPAAV